MPVVDIYLPAEPESTTSSEWIHALSIPRQDIKRLTLRPLKWLHFATFTVCGAKGDLSATQEGEIVDYDNVLFSNLGDRYYYTPDGTYHFVDHHALDDECTSSAATPRRTTFREDVCRRDERCVVTRTMQLLCDAVHIIPHSRGSQYVTHVIRDRSNLYEHPSFSLGGDFDINRAENGMLLTKDLHFYFGGADAVFLKTPNFAMEAVDVPRIEQGPVPDKRTTLQYIVPPVGLDRVPPRDVLADWSQDNAPQSLFLDFMYGVAIVRHWACDSLGGMLQRRVEDGFSKILNKVEIPGHEEDPDQEALKGKQKERRTFSSDAKASMLEAMDTVLMLSMLVRKSPPQSMVEEAEKRVKEKELRSQEQSAEKVRQWLGSDL